MKDALANLAGSRKFLIMCVSVMVLGGLVMAGKMPMENFVSTLKDLSMVLIAAIGAEGVAEKWNK